MTRMPSVGYYISIVCFKARSAANHGTELEASCLYQSDGKKRGGDPLALYGVGIK